MASPIYNPSGASGCYWGHSLGQRWGVVKRAVSWFRGGTPQYYGSGQPTPDGDVSSGSGTPAYMAALPLKCATQNAATAPQPNPVAIVVPRS